MARQPPELAEQQRLLGQYLAALRKAAGLYQADIARAVPCHRTNVAHAEGGSQLPDAHFWETADRVVGANGALVVRYDSLIQAKQAHAADLQMRRRAKAQATVQQMRVGPTPARGVTADDPTPLHTIETFRRRVTPADRGLDTDTNNDLAHGAEADNSCDLVKVSQRSWHDARKYVGLNQATLHARAVELYAPSWRLPQAPMLSQPSWLPDTPIALEDIALEWEPNPPKPIIVGCEPEVRSLLPLRTPRQAFPSYSSAIRYLSPPALFENRPCYRLLGATLSGGTQARLRFGQSCYFDKIDVSEALVHELSSVMINSTDARLELPFRSLISDPFDLALRAVNTSIVTLTIRRDPANGEATFFLLRRDPAKVVTGGGEYCLIPAGEFQPASVSPGSVLSDLNIWRNIVREYSEELLGQPEHDGNSGRPVDYEHWPFFRAMQKAREQNELRVYVLGVALHALSLNAAIVTVAVIDSSVFDFLFREAAHVNAEGEVVVRWGDDKEGQSLSFDDATVSRFLHTEQLVSSTALTGLSLAWRHRATVLDPTG